MFKVRFVNFGPEGSFLSSPMHPVWDSHVRHAISSKATTSVAAPLLTLRALLLLRRPQVCCTNCGLSSCKDAKECTRQHNARASASRIDPGRLFQFRPQLLRRNVHPRRLYQFRPQLPRRSAHYNTRALPLSARHSLSVPAHSPCLRYVR